MFKRARFLGWFLLVASTGAFAAADGFYVGGNMGMSYAAYSHTDFNYMTSASRDPLGFAGGLSFGYQMSPMLAVQLGYTRPHRVNLSSITMASNTPGGLTSLSNGSITLNVFDLALKGMIPLKYNFGLNAKAGLAYVNADVDGGLNQSNLGSMYKDNSRFLPEAGVGASYDINTHVTTDVGYTHIFHGGNIQNIDMAMAELAYHFG